MRTRREIALALVLGSLLLGACGWDPRKPFDRDTPAVKQAIGELDAGDPKAATATLEDYLSTGACDEGKIGTPELLKRRPNGTFDLGLSLFGVGETYGKRFGEEETDGGDAKEALRSAQVDCALRVVRAIAEQPALDHALRAHAHYLEGNLLFLAGRYEEAVTAYDAAIQLEPAFSDGGDAFGRDAAWNRAIALRRIDKKDAGKDASNDGSQDGSGDGASEGGGDGGGDGASKNDDKDGASPPPDGGDDAGNDASTPPPKPPDQDAATPPPQQSNQDERMLDQLENAPTVQQEAAKKNQRRRVRGMADK